MIKLAQIEQSFHVDINTLFSYVTDMENYGEWFPGIIKITAIGDASNQGVGKSYLEELNLNNELARLTITVVQYEKNKIFETHGDLSPLYPMMKMAFEQQGDHVLFSLSYFSRNNDLANHFPLIESIKADIQQRANIAFKQLSVILKND